MAGSWERVRWLRVSEMVKAGIEITERPDRCRYCLSECHPVDERF